MKILIFALFAISSTVIVDAVITEIYQSRRIIGVASGKPAGSGTDEKKVICVYNSTSITREGIGKVSVAEIDPALAFCDILVYGWAGIDPITNKLKSLNEKIDLDAGQGLYRQVTNLKTKYQKLKVLLGVGGNADPNSDIYHQFLENPAAYGTFINSAYTILKNYNFDGFNFAWQFKTNKAKRIRSGIGSFLYSVKKTSGLAGKPLDENGEQHKNAYNELIRQVKNAIRPENYLLTITVLPNQNTTVHYDVAGLISNVDYVILAAYDYQTWERNPNEVDYPAPIYAPTDRIPESNIDFQVSLWLQKGAPANKLIVGIPTHGRSWKLKKDSTTNGIPPILEVEKPGSPGIQTNQAGFLSYPEVCSLLPNPSNTGLTGEHKALIPTREAVLRYGSYAYRLPDEKGMYGLWVGYEDPETAQSKASYVLNKHLAGVSIHDLNDDDFRGACTTNNDKYAILRATKYRLQQS